MKLRTLLATSLLCVGLQSQASTQPDSYYDNKEGAKIAQCIRQNMQNAPEQTAQSMQLKQNWFCQQLMYLWDESQHLQILIVRNDFDSPTFRFVPTEYSDSDMIFDNATPMTEDKKRYGHFSHEFLSGFFSYVMPGPAPRRQDFLTFKDGYLFWEESVENEDYNLPLIPALRERPMALYKNYRGIPEFLKRRVTTYGVCSAKPSQAERVVPCF